VGVYDTLHASRRHWREEQLGDLKPTVYDWCRMAAFLDGEGQIQINPFSNRKFGSIFQVRILVYNTDPALMLWLTATFGGNVVSRQHDNPKWKRSYTWSCTAGRAAWILHNCLPWFILKKPQAELLIEMQDRIDLTVQGRNRRLSDEERDYRKEIHRSVKALNAKGPRENLKVEID
jgi:hypothetical protein